MELPQSVMEMRLRVVKCGDCLYACTKARKPWCYLKSVWINPRDEACSEVNKRKAVVKSR